MPVSKAQQKAVAKYENENYDKILVRLNKGQRKEIKAVSAHSGMSVNAFINQAIKQAMQGNVTLSAAAPFDAWSILPDDTIQLLQAHLQVVGADVNEYFVRAVQAMIKRETLMLQGKFTPADLNYSAYK